MIDAATFSAQITLEPDAQQPGNDLHCRIPVGINSYLRSVISQIPIPRFQFPDSSARYESSEGQGLTLNIAHCDLRLYSNTSTDCKCT